MREDSVHLYGVGQRSERVSKLSIIICTSNTKHANNILYISRQGVEHAPLCNHTYTTHMNVMSATDRWSHRSRTVAVVDKSASSTTKLYYTESHMIHKVKHSKTYNSIQSINKKNVATCLLLVIRFSLTFAMRLRHTESLRSQLSHRVM